MTENTVSPHYRERLLPGPGMFIAWLLLIPAVSLVMTPINRGAAIPTAVVLYLVVAAIFVLTSPTIEVRDGTLTAGRASIPVDLVGTIEALGEESLRASIGQEADARNYLLVRGWIHRGLKLEIVDESDPTPYWIVTSRKPLALAKALGATVSG